MAASAAERRRRKNCDGEQADGAEEHGRGPEVERCACCPADGGCGFAGGRAAGDQGDADAAASDGDAGHERGRLLGHEPQASGGGGGDDFDGAALFGAAGDAGGGEDGVEAEEHRRQPEHPPLDEAAHAVEGVRFAVEELGSGQAALDLLEELQARLLVGIGFRPGSGSHDQQHAETDSPAEDAHADVAKRLGEDGTEHHGCASSPS